MVEIDDVLNRLAAINPALRRAVELRVFQGLTREEIACEMGCGTATVARHWSFARNWLEEPVSGDYAPSRDGQRFLVKLPVDPVTYAPIYVIVNWDRSKRPGP